jgi:protein SCO1
LGNEANKVQPLFITVDPKRDTRQVLGDYLKSFDPRIIGLTGSEEQTAAAAKAYRVYSVSSPGKAKGE